MAILTMVATMCVYIRTEYIYDWGDYIIGAILSMAAGFFWPIVLGVAMLTWLCHGILYLFDCLNRGW